MRDALLRPQSNTFLNLETMDGAIFLNCSMRSMPIRLNRNHTECMDIQENTKKDVIQLQAAGTWAYESYKHSANSEITGIKTPDSFKPLFRGAVDAQFNTFDNKPALDAMVARYLALGGLVTKGGIVLKPE